MDYHDKRPVHNRKHPRANTPYHAFTSKTRGLVPDGAYLLAEREVWYPTALLWAKREVWYPTVRICWQNSALWYLFVTGWPIWYPAFGKTGGLVPEKAHCRFCDLGFLQPVGTKSAKLA